MTIFIIFFISCATKSQTDSKFEKVPDIKMNRLANEQSPYLLQHANNPVDWYPWGKEAFNRAIEASEILSYLLIFFHYSILLNQQA